MDTEKRIAVNRNGFDGAIRSIMYEKWREWSLIESEKINNRNSSGKDE